MVVVMVVVVVVVVGGGGGGGSGGSGGAAAGAGAGGAGGEVDAGDAGAGWWGFMAVKPHQIVGCFRAARIPLMERPQLTTDAQLQQGHRLGEWRQNNFVGEGGWGVDMQVGEQEGGRGSHR